MPLQLEEQVLKDGDKVRFVPSTERYGTAEFIVCQCLFRGKLKELIVWPAQQPDARFFYRIPLHYSPSSWSISSWTHKGIDEPRIWQMFWCKQHKAPAFRLYVPREANHFTVSMLSDFRVIFDKE